jgi:alpha-D-ribose 1-methylphosphonate 5-phosphate C-P lyase
MTIISWDKTCLHCFQHQGVLDRAVKLSLALISVVGSKQEMVSSSEYCYRRKNKGGVDN